MQTDIHPKNYRAIKVSCACGANFEINSVMKNDELVMESCFQCNRVFTGKKSTVTHKGRVESFAQKYKKASKAEK